MISVISTKMVELDLKARVFAASNDSGMQAVGSLCEANLERIKKALVSDTTWDEVGKLRGEAKAYKAVLRWIKEPPLPVDNQ
jgi:hypothetical protein